MAIVVKRRRVSWPNLMWLARRGWWPLLPRNQIIEISEEKVLFFHPRRFTKVSANLIISSLQHEGLYYNVVPVRESFNVAIAELATCTILSLTHSLALTHTAVHTQCVYMYIVAVPTTTTVPESKTGEPSESALFQQNEIKSKRHSGRTRSGGRRLRALSIKQWNTAARVDLFHINISTPAAYLAADIESRRA